MVISFIINLHSLGVITPVHKPVADIRQIITAGDFGQFWIGEASLEQVLEGVLRRFQLVFQFLLVCLGAFGVFERRGGSSDARDLRIGDGSRGCFIGVEGDFDRG